MALKKATLKYPKLWLFAICIFFCPPPHGHPSKQLREITCRQETWEPVNPRQIKLSRFSKSSKAITRTAWSCPKAPLDESGLCFLHDQTSFFQHAACFFLRLSNTPSAPFSGAATVPFFLVQVRTCIMASLIM